MAKEKAYMVFGFETTLSAFAFERYCKKLGIEGRMITVPRQMSAGCGMAYRISEESFEQLPEMLQKPGEDTGKLWKDETERMKIDVGATLRMMM